METFELVQLKNGIMSLRALEPRETFHPGVGPVKEATVLHVEQQRLVERCLASPNFTIWDVGLGAAANAVAALRVLKAGLPEGHPVTLHSFDKTTSPLEFALQNASALDYPQGFEAPLRALLDNGRVEIAPGIVWQLHLGDFSQLIKSEKLPAPDSIFYDPYSPSGNPEMWTLDNFVQLHAALDPARTCLLTNYSRATIVRVSFLLAGFYVGIGCSVHEKEETLLVSNKLEALERPLTREWLEKRVRVSHSAAPLRSARYEVRPLGDGDFAALQAHPQFIAR